MNELKVVFVVKESGAVVSKLFDSEYLCRIFVNKAMRSKKLCLVSYPLFGL